jgi:hypothetical protein
MFMENIELLIFSTPVKCLGVRGRVVDMSEEGSSTASDNRDAATLD